MLQPIPPLVQPVGRLGPGRCSAPQPLSKGQEREMSLQPKGRTVLAGALPTAAASMVLVFLTSMASAGPPGPGMPPPDPSPAPPPSSPPNPNPPRPDPYKGRGGHSSPDAYEGVGGREGGSSGGGTYGGPIEQPPQTDAYERIDTWSPRVVEPRSDAGEQVSGREVGCSASHRSSGGFLVILLVLGLIRLASRDSGRRDVVSRES